MCVDMFDYNVLILKSLKNEYNWDMGKKNAYLSVKVLTAKIRLQGEILFIGAKIKNWKNLLCFHPIPKTAFLLFYSTFQSIKSCDLNPLKPHSKNLKFDIFGWPGIFWSFHVQLYCKTLAHVADCTPCISNRVFAYYYPKDRSGVETVG